MRCTVLAPVVLSAVLLAAPASASLSEFRLPGAPTSPPEPDRQGPVAPDVPESRRPAPTPTPTASRAPTPAPTPAPSARIEVPVLTAPSPAPSRTLRSPAATPRPSSSAAPVAAGTPAPGATAPVPAEEPVATPARSPLPAPQPAANPATPAHEGPSPWLWVLAGLVAVGAIAFAGLAWRRRRPVPTPATVAPIERPRLQPQAPLPPDLQPAMPKSEPLQVALEPLRLSLTLMNATLSYRLEVANRGTAPIANLRIGADMIAAHASMTREEQLSGPDGTATVQRIERIEPGDSRIVEGEFRVPFTQIVPIRQGSATLLLPLARFRLQAEGAAPVVRTFAVGQPGANAALQPFRLDLGPRVYPNLAQRAFA